MRHFAIQSMAQEQIDRICQRLRGVSNHADMLDWFEQFRRELYPETEDGA